MWRLVLSDISNFTFNEVFHQMTQDEIEEANMALDLQIEAINNAINKK